MAVALVLLTACAANPGSASVAASASAGPASVAPSASAANPSPSVASHYCPDPGVGGVNTCLGSLQAGTYQTSSFHPPLSYTVPAGWDNEEDLPGNFLVLPPGSTIGGVNLGTSDIWVVPPSRGKGPRAGSPSTTAPLTFLSGLGGCFRNRIRGSRSAAART